MITEPFVVLRLPHHLGEWFVAGILILLGLAMSSRCRVHIVLSRPFPAMMLITCPMRDTCITSR